MTTHVKGRERPRVSVAKLGEYAADATPSRRERILRDAKFPAPYIPARYLEAAAAVRRCLLDGGDVSAALAAEATRIAALPSMTKSEQTARDCSARALRALGRRVEALPLKGVTAIPLGRPSVKLSIEGVSVSVCPQVLLARRLRAGSTQYGALLIVMRMSEALRPRSGQAVADLLRRALATMGLEQEGTIDPRLCLVVDVFHPGIFHAAERGGRRIARDVECACREIAARWPAIERAA